MSVTERDYELISAYLDGELTGSEQADLEARLKTDPELQRELQSLRQTVALIRQLPERPAPRNFTLDSRAFGRPALPFPLTMTFSALSAAAAVLLFVFGGYFLLQAGSLPLMTASAPQQQSVAQSSAPPQAAAIAELPTATLTALPTQTVPPPTPTAQPLPTQAAALNSQMAQLADTEHDETAAAASEPAADQAGGMGLFAATEAMQAPATSEAQEESGNVAEAPAASGESATNSVGGGGGVMATAAAPMLAVPSPTSVAASKSSNTPEMAMRAMPSGEQNAFTETPANGEGTAVANAENEGTVGRVDDHVRQTAAAAVDSRGMIGVGLLAAGALLLVAAILTTIVRQRRFRP